MNIQKFRVGKQFDRRRKLTDEQKEEIKRIYATKEYSQKRLAIKFGVSESTIYRIVTPNAELRRKDSNRKYWAEHKNNRSSEKNNEGFKRHLQYKRSLIENGKIGNEVF